VYGPVLSQYVNTGSTCGEYFIRLNVRVSAYQSAFRYSDIIMLNTNAVGVFAKRCVMMANLSFSRI